YITEVSHKEPEEIRRIFADVSSKLEKNMLTTAEQIRRVGIKEGVEWGKKEGIEEGIERGMERGIEQGIQRRNLEIAKQMLSELGMDVDLVHRATGLSLQDLSGLV
ncbi:MAG: hypothetical protein AAFU83_03880, partial [Bacteroidota bacterium]